MDRETERLQRVYSGATVAETLEVDAGALEGLRRQAEAQLSAGRWAACLERLDALERLGAVGPLDALMRARCHRSLGQAAEAERWAEVARGVLTKLDAALGAEGEAR